jgi:hypothetical protein
VLLADKGIGEDQVIPTLALHNLIDELSAGIHDNDTEDWGDYPRAPCLAQSLLNAEHDRQAWERAGDKFVGFYVTSPRSKYLRPGHRL